MKKLLIIAALSVAAFSQESQQKQPVNLERATLAYLQQSNQSLVTYASQLEALVQQQKEEIARLTAQVDSLKNKKR